MMRHAARLTLLSLLLWANAVAADAPTKITVIGDQSYPPFSFLDEGKPSGIYVDVLTKVFAQLPEYDIDIMMMPWRRGLAEIKNSRALAIFPPYYFPKERPYIGAYSIPILTEHVVLMCDSSRVSGTQTLIWPQDFKRKRITANKGYLLIPDFLQSIATNHITHIEVSGARSAIHMMLLNRADCFMHAELPTRWELDQLTKEQPELEKKLTTLHFTGTQIGQSGYIGYSADTVRYPFRDRFRAKVDRVLKALIANGEIQSIIDRYRSQLP